MLRHKTHVLLLALAITLVFTALPSNAITSKKHVGIALNTTHVLADLEVLAAVATVNRITIPPTVKYVVEPTGHLILFLKQKIIVQNLITEQKKILITRPLCKPVILDGLSETKYILLVCANNLAYYLDLGNSQQFYGPYRLVESVIVGVKRVGEYIVTVHANGLIVVYKDPIVDPYKTVKLPVQENIDGAYITQAKGNYTLLIAVVYKLQDSWFVAVVDLNTGSIVYTYKSSTPLIAAYIVDAHSPYKFKLLTIKYNNDVATLELTAIDGSKPVLRVQEYVQLPAKPRTHLYTIRQSYILLIVGGGVGHLIDVHPGKMLVKPRFTWHYTPTIREYVPLIIYKDREYIVTVDYEGMRLLDSSGIPVWYVAVPCGDPVLVYGLKNIVVVGYNGKLVVVKPKQEFFEKLALLTIYTPRLYIDIAKRMFIPTITVSGVGKSVHVSMKGEKLSLLLPIAGYRIEIMYEELGVTYTVHIVLEPPGTRVEIPVRMASYTICVRGFADPLHLLPPDKPLAKAVMQIYTIEGVKLGKVETDDEGCVRVSLPYARYSVKIDAPGYVGGVFDVFEPSTIIYLKPKLVSLEVKVVDAVTGYEIPDARVELIGFEKRVVIPANSRLMVPPGNYVLLVSAEGYMLKKVEVVVDKSERVEVRLEPSITEIRVVNSLTGQPVDKFHVNIVGSTIYGANYSVSREASQVVLLKLPPGYYIVKVSAKGYNVREFTLKAPALKIVKLEPKPLMVVERQVKAVFELVTSNFTIATAIVASIVVVIAIARFRKKIGKVFEEVRRRVREAGKAREKREEMLEELKKLIEEAGI